MWDTHELSCIKVLQGKDWSGEKKERVATWVKGTSSEDCAERAKERNEDSEDNNK